MVEIADLPPMFTTAMARASGLHPRDLYAARDAGCSRRCERRMKRPTRASLAGSAYLHLQNRARTKRRGTQELLTLYIVERWLARLALRRMPANS